MDRPGEPGVFAQAAASGGAVDPDAGSPPGELVPGPWEAVRFGADGLVPVVVQDAGSGAVLMLAWADREALRRTLASRRAWFWSRSRSALWEKGETSGNYLDVVDVRLDCDGDAVLYRVRPRGPACHTGQVSCFHRGEEPGYPAASSLGQTLDALARVVRERARTRPPGSYVARLLGAGHQRALQKVGEEAVEFAIAGCGTDHTRTVEEAADLAFHLLVALEACGVDPGEVAAELGRRAGRSGG